MHFPNHPTNIFQSLRKLSPNPRKILLKPSQNHPQSFPNRWKFEFWSPNSPKSKKNCLGSMCPSLLDVILTPKASQGRPKSLPEGSKMHPKTRKDLCEKTSRFRAGFYHCFGEVFGSFFHEISKRNHAQSVKNDNLKNAMKHWPWRQNQGLALITKNKD